MPLHPLLASTPLLALGEKSERARWDSESIRRTRLVWPWYEASMRRVSPRLLVRLGGGLRKVVDEEGSPVRARSNICGMKAKVVVSYACQGVIGFVEDGVAAYSVSKVDCFVGKLCNRLWTRCLLCLRFCWRCRCSHAGV